MGRMQFSQAPGGLPPCVVCVFPLLAMWGLVCQQPQGLLACDNVVPVCVGISLIRVCEVIVGVILQTMC